jgi:hypothetical protein
MYVHPLHRGPGQRAAERPPAHGLTRVVELGLRPFQQLRVLGGQFRPDEPCVDEGVQLADPAQRLLAPEEVNPAVRKSTFAGTVAPFVMLRDSIGNTGRGYGGEL